MKTMSWSAGDDMETQISIIKSFRVMKRTAEKLKLISGSALKENSELSHLDPNIVNLVDNLQSKIDILAEPFTNIIKINATDSVPAFSQQLANTIALAYKEVHVQKQTSRTVEAIKYIAAQLKKVRLELKESEEEFTKFTQKHQLVSIDLQSENLIVRIQQIKNELQKLNTTQSEINSLLLKLDRFVKNPVDSGNNFYSTYASEQYKAANDSLMALLLNVDSLLKDYTNKHPQVVAIKRNIIETARMMKILLQLQNKDIDNKKIELEKSLAGVEVKTDLLMAKKLEYDRMKRKVTSYNDMVVLLEKKNQEALITRSEKPDEVTIVKPARLPIYPINPPKTAAKGTAGAVIGLILGMVIAFMVETFDTSLGAISEVEKEVGVPVVGIIPHLGAKAIKKAQQGQKSQASLFKEKIQLIAHFDPQSMVAENFRGLRSNICFHNLEKKIKTLIVTASSPGEGKTSIACNLAITMARLEMKTLLVGCDLRKPTLYRAFGMEKKPGLVDVLLGTYSPQDVIRTITDLIMGEMGMDDVMATPGLDNLHIMTCGNIPTNPSDLIESKALMNLINDLKKEYDFIIIDTPPILSTNDPVMLGSIVDATLLVYRIGSVSKALLKRSVLQLSQTKSNLIGVVLNDMKAEVSPDFQDYKHYKSYYSYGKEKKNKPANGGIKKLISLITRK